jgi:hypothetical protein
MRQLALQLFQCLLALLQGRLAQQLLLQRSLLQTRAQAPAKESRSISMQNKHDDFILLSSTPPMDLSLSRAAQRHNAGCTAVQFMQLFASRVLTRQSGRNNAHHIRAARL